MVAYDRAVNHSCMLLSPWPHLIECLTFAASGVFMGAELFIGFHSELLALLQHELGSMPTWGQHDQVADVPDHTHMYTCPMAADARLP